MPLVAQLLGLLTAGGLVFALARYAGADRRQALAAITVIPVTVSAMLAIAALPGASQAFRDSRQAGSAISERDAERIGGIGIGLDVAFLDWARERLDGDDTFHLVVGGSHDPGAVDQWATYQLAPHLSTDPLTADWLIFYDRSPKERRAADDARVLSYAPRFWMTETADAR